MEVQVKQIKFLKNNPLPTQRKTLPDLGFYNVNPYCVCVFSGSRGSGKTTQCVNLIKKMGSLNGLKAIVSTTYDANEDVFQHIEPDEVYTPDNENITDFIDKTKMYHHEVEAEKEYHRVYQKFKKNRHSVTEEELSLLEREDIRTPDQLKLLPVCHTLILDDCAYQAILKKNTPLSNLVIRNRHLKINVFILIQNWHLLQKSLRQNLSDIFLFKTHDAVVLEDISREISNVIDKENFIALFQKYITEKHDFLWISLNPNMKWPSNIRKNFNTFLKIKS